jgi:hypothetical protein
VLPDLARDFAVLFHEIQEAGKGLNFVVFAWKLQGKGGTISNNAPMASLPLHELIHMNYKFWIGIGAQFVEIKPLTLSVN